MVARVVDGLPLVGTMQDDEQVISNAHTQLRFRTTSKTLITLCLQSGKSVLEYQNQAKMLFRKLGPHSPPKCSIETGPYLFQWVVFFEFRTVLLHTGRSYLEMDAKRLFFLFSYLIENDVCFLVMCDKMYSKRLAFNYLEDISQEFHKNYGRKVNSVTRPYAFIEFDVYIQKSKKQLTDRRRNINTINNQLQDVQRIMVRLL